MDPIKRIRSDREDARNKEDANADICFLALAGDSTPTVRTLVLRDVSAEGFTLFINTTSEKWSIIQKNNRAEILLWYPSSQTQYRVSGTITELDRAVIEKNWYRRPSPAKYMDYSYTSLGKQGSEIESRDVLVQHIKKLKQDHPEDELVTPETAIGILLQPDSIELLDLNMPDRVHDRKRYTKDGDGWNEVQLVP